MSGDLYLIQFKGDIAEGFSIGDVKHNLAALFKVPPEKIEKLFSGTPAVIRKNVDRATALRYQAAMKKAGAISRVIPVKSPDIQPKPQAQAETNQSGFPAVITVKNVRGKLDYSPIPCNAISGNASALDLNRPDMRNVPFSSIRLVSIFREQPDPDGPATDWLALFLEHSKRPFLVGTDRIRFNVFPGVAGQNTVCSVQNFIGFLFRNNRDLRIDHKTELFLRESEYIVIENQPGHLTSVGEALES